jgi:hypothetical protein
MGSAKLRASDFRPLVRAEPAGARKAGELALFFQIALFLPRSVAASSGSPLGTPYGAWGWLLARFELSAKGRQIGSIRLRSGQACFARKVVKFFVVSPLFT